MNKTNLLRRRRQWHKLKILQHGNFHTKNNHVTHVALTAFETFANPFKHCTDAPLR